MNRITKLTLAVLAILMTAVVPQSMQAQSSERSISPGTGMNKAMMRGGTNLSAFGINASSLLAQNGEKIVTKTPSSTPIVYIGESLLTIPTVADGKMYYTYSDANGLGDGSKDSYNVAVSLASDGTLNLTFKDLEVKKNHQSIVSADVAATSAVYINYSGKTILTLEGKSSLTGVDNTSIFCSASLYSEGDIEIQGSGSLTTTGGKAEYSMGIYGLHDLTINLNGGSLKATGGEALHEDSYGLAADNKMSIQGNGTIIAEGGKAYGFSEGINASDLLTIALDGGSLTASGGEAIHSKSAGLGSIVINISSGIVTAQGHTVATISYFFGDPLAPSIYSGAIVEAGTEYDGSNAGVYDPSKIGTYKYLHVGGYIMKTTIEGINKSYDYTGFAITPKPVVKYGDETLVEGKDYTVSYANNVDPGTATITITGIGNFIGSRMITFTINPEPSTDNAYVNLPFVTGISTNPIAGTYSVTKGESFSFTIALKEGYEESKPIVTANRKVVTPNEKGEYVIEKIMENVDITITGITATGVEGIPAKTAIWTSGHSLNIRTSRPQQLQVISIVGSVAILRNIPAGDTTINTLGSGVYIVRLTDGTIAKVIIR